MSEQPTAAATAAPTPAKSQKSKMKRQEKYGGAADDEGSEYI